MIETVAELRAKLEGLPDDAPIVIENRCDRARFVLFRADPFGRNTSEPFLRIMTADEGCSCTTEIPVHEQDEMIAQTIKTIRIRIRVRAWIAALVMVTIGSFCVANWVTTGEGFWSVGVPGSLLLVAGSYSVLRQWRRR